MGGGGGGESECVGGERVCGLGGSGEIVCVGGVSVLGGESNNNVHLSCAHQRSERSHDTY